MRNEQKVGIGGGTFCALPGFTVEVDLGEARPLPLPIDAGILDQGWVIKFVIMVSAVGCSAAQI